MNERHLKEKSKKFNYFKQMFNNEHRCYYAGDLILELNFPNKIITRNSKKPFRPWVPAITIENE